MTGVQTCALPISMMRIKLADAEKILKKEELNKLDFLEKSKAKVAKPLGKQ